MSLQFLPCTMMIFGALMTMLGGGFYLLDKRSRLLSRLDEKPWFFYLSTAVILAISILLTIVINSIWRP
jgi:hypothetical protein